MYTNRPQKLGSGTTTRYITMDFTVSTSASILNLGDQLYSDEEMQTYMQRYNYMKISYIKAKITPTSNTGKIWLLGEWNAKTSSITNNDLLNNDSAKIVATHAMKFQTRTWLPPDMNATKVDKTTTSETISTINLRRFNRTDDYYYSKGTTVATYSILFPFTLAMQSTISIDVSIIVKAVFRGEKYNTTLNTMLKMYNTDKELKDKVDNIMKSQIIEKHALRKCAEFGQVVELNDPNMQYEEVNLNQGEQEEEIKEIKEVKEAEKQEIKQDDKKKEEIEHIINKLKEL
jgi:hypothetical protein